MILHGFNKNNELHTLALFYGQVINKYDADNRRETCIRRIIIYHGVRAVALYLNKVLSFNYIMINMCLYILFIYTQR